MFDSSPKIIMRATVINNQAYLSFYSHKMRIPSQNNCLKNSLVIQTDLLL